MKVRLAEKYPDGIKVRKPRKKISLQYEASSRTFSVNLSKLIGDVPDVSGLSAPISKTQSIADDVMDELDKLSRYLGRNPDAVGSLKAASLLPAELVAEFGGDVARLLQSWLQEQYSAHKGIVMLSELAQRATSHDGIKITKALFTEIEQLMTTLGWNMVPSANELISVAKPETKVLLLPAEFGGNALDAPSVDFRLALFELTLGSFIAHTDTGIRSIEMEHLVKRLGSMNSIGKAERDRLHCCLQWLAVQQADIAALMRKLKKLDPDSQISFANLAVAIAAADGVIAHQEVKVLESIYKAMSLDKKELFSNLHSMAGRSDVVPTGGSSKGDGSVRLDKDRIAATLHDTAKASNLLARIFVEDEIEPEDSIDDTEEPPKDSVALFNGLDNAHAQLLQELLGKEEWPRDEYERLAASFKLMPDGAMEIVNEWAYEKFDDAIIEDEDPVFIHMNIIQEEGQNE